MRSRTTLLLAAAVAASWVTVCDAIGVFPESVAEVGLFPFPLYLGGLPIHVVVLFIAFYLSMIIASWAGKGRYDKEVYQDYLEEYFEEHGIDFPDLDLEHGHGRGRRAVGYEATMRHAMRRTLRKLDVDRCLLKLVCHLESQDDRTMEEELLLRIFPSEGCGKSLFENCAGKAEQLREVLKYYQRMAGLLISANEAGAL